eukprot:764497-Hanusia_phi.AAC.6
MEMIGWSKIELRFQSSRSFERNKLHGSAMAKPSVLQIDIRQGFSTKTERESEDVVQKDATQYPTFRRGRGGPIRQC